MIHEWKRIECAHLVQIVLWIGKVSVLNFDVLSWIGGERAKRTSVPELTVSWPIRKDRYLEDTALAIEWASHIHLEVLIRNFV